jgi:polyhydroxyalkanoate synthesis regulator protein
MDSFRRNQEQFKSAVEGAFANSPFAEMAKRNIAMFEAAASAFKPGEGPASAGATQPTPAQASAASAESADDVAALKAQLAQLQDKIEKLAK